MKKVYFVLAAALIIATGGYLMAAPNGGYVIWHQVGKQTGKFITVDFVGCQVHLASHPDDFVSSGSSGPFTCD